MEPGDFQRQGPPGGPSHCLESHSPTLRLERVLLLLQKRQQVIQRFHQLLRALSLVKLQPKSSGSEFLPPGEALLIAHWKQWRPVDRATPCPITHIPPLRPPGWAWLPDTRKMQIRIPGIIIKPTQAFSFCRSRGNFDLCQ